MRWALLGRAFFRAAVAAHLAALAPHHAAKPAGWDTRPVPVILGAHCVNVDFHTYTAMIDLGDRLPLAGAIGITCGQSPAPWGAGK
jgi:hypothetical protein